MLKLWIIGALCGCLAGCGARSAMLSDDDASAGDAAVTPDALQGCVRSLQP